MFIYLFYFKFSIMIMCQSYETETIKNNSYLSKDCIYVKFPTEYQIHWNYLKGGCSSLDSKIEKNQAKS